MLGEIKLWKFKALFVFALSFFFFSQPVIGGSREQAQRLHNRLAGVPPSAAVLDAMEGLIEGVGGDEVDAAYLAMENDNFYNVTLLNFITPWTNEAQTVFAPLNDYSATVIGMVRDDVDFRNILFADVLYTANPGLGLTAYNNNNNTHYVELQSAGYSLQDELVPAAQAIQSEITGLAAAATAGVLTSRAAAKAFFSGGTNRAMLRFTLINHLCTDLEQLKDTTLSPDRIRQDVSRSPGGDSRIFLNGCVGCHTGMDPLAQAFAYYEYNAVADSDLGQLQYNDVGEINGSTGSRVQAKYHINESNFPTGFITPDDQWANYWRSGQNRSLGWSPSLPGSGSGAKSMGEELANSAAFASCQVEKVFQSSCLRKPENSTDRLQVSTMVGSFINNGHQLKQVFAESAIYCMGE